jgi:hypothetical protein
VNAITLTRDQRDALREEALLDLSGIGDMRIYIDQHEWPEAQEFRQRFEDDFRLLDDLGWSPLDGRDWFELTMLADQRERLFRRILDGVDGCLRDFSPDLPDDIPPEYVEEELRIIEINRQAADRDLELRLICVAVLDGEDG